MLSLIATGILGGIIITFLVFGFTASPFVISKNINKHISKIENKNLSKRLNFVLKVVRNVICILFSMILVLTAYKLFCRILLNIIQ
ncbi:hypothetical protein [Clostridium butyricum]|uniref:hypothetical protein n=1 Tax=Clostridium butyricum TaxID=1492 RepID=UPI0022E49FD3|nr:hypothetical protein [Clostridium butyricum]MDU3584408.1 hypothetical protein [Clostridium butyricum]